MSEPIAISSVEEVEEALRHLESAAVLAGQLDDEAAGKSLLVNALDAALASLSRAMQRSTDTRLIRAPLGEPVQSSEIPELALRR